MERGLEGTKDLGQTAKRFFIKLLKEYSIILRFFFFEIHVGVIRGFVPTKRLMSLAPILFQIHGLLIG